MICRTSASLGVFPAFSDLSYQSFKAIEKVVNSQAELKLYLVSAVTEGTDSLGEVTVRLEKNGVIVNGLGTDTDVIVASVKAYLNALNLLDAGILKAHPQKGV